jgi:hypothetical protein
MPFSFGDAITILRTACADCHGPDVAEGDFSLRDAAERDSLGTQFSLWQNIRQRLADRSMPPPDAAPLERESRDRLVSWIESASLAALCEQPPVAGPPMLRRLARHEYANSVRDLLDIHFDAGQALPEDAAGGEGFANTAETLTISPIHAEKYLQAATDALQYAARDQQARRRLLFAQPDTHLGEEGAAEQNLLRLARRAFRRPVTRDEIEPYVQLFRAARSDQLTFDEATLYAMRGILISPHFLFIIETTPRPPSASAGLATGSDAAEPLTSHELATRLSYFLWASIPDDDLRRAADEGRLQDDQELASQARRLIKQRGTHLQDAMDHFMGSWLGTADLGRSRHVDRQRHPGIEDPHVAALRNQPVYAMVSMLRENDSVLALIDAPWTMLNNELARVYRIDKKKIEQDFVQRLVRVVLPEDYRYRGGLLGMGGVLTVSSYPRRTSPVLRGAWVLEKMLGVELPPPPPDVPALDESAEAVQAGTLRERLLQHRQDPACASCHDRIDPLGFALENFDELGRWRDRDEGGPIDPVASLPDGSSIDGPAGLKQYLLARKDTFVRVLTRKMLGYALGRSLRPPDLCTVESIVRRLHENDYRAQELVLGIVMSQPFREKSSAGEREALEPHLP